MANGITVDRDFARFGSKSYAINKINTVEVRERKPHGIIGALICSSIALICLISVFPSLNTPGGNPGASIAFTLIFGGLALWLWRRSGIIEYQLFLMTSSSEAQAFTSRSGDEVYGLRDSIEQAMVGRTE
jgi:hypothetical protein